MSRKKPRAAAGAKAAAVAIRYATPPTPGRSRKLLRRVVVAVAALSVAGLGAWYVLAPPVPTVRLDAGADPALVQAVAQARGAVRRAPWSDGPRGRLGMLLQAHGLNAEAAACYEQAERLNPDEPRWPYLHAYLVADDPPQALGLWRRAAELSERRGETTDAPQLRRADACLEQGLFDEAGEAYRALLDRRPDHPHALLGLARLALRRGRPGYALDHLRRCADSPWARSAARRLAAQARGRLGDRPAELPRKGREPEPPPDRPWPDPWADELAALRVGRQARVMRLQQLQAEGRLAEAAGLARQVVEEYPDVGWLELGRVRLAKQEWAGAEAALREALGRDPESAEAAFALGQALLGQQKYDEAARTFRRLLVREPAHAGPTVTWRTAPAPGATARRPSGCCGRRCVTGRIAPTATASWASCWPPAAGATRRPSCSTGPSASTPTTLARGRSSTGPAPRARASPEHGGNGPRVQLRNGGGFWPVVRPLPHRRPQLQHPSAPGPGWPTDMSRTAARGPEPRALAPARPAAAAHGRCRRVPS
jgi:tetratricopeptide (TPR) repeat protein